MPALHLNCPSDGFILQYFHLKLTKNCMPIRMAKKKKEEEEEEEKEKEKENPTPPNAD